MRHERRSPAPGKTIQIAARRQAKFSPAVAPKSSSAADLQPPARLAYLHHTRDELERSMRAPDRSVLDVAAAARVRHNGRRAA